MLRDDFTPSYRAVVYRLEWHAPVLAASGSVPFHVLRDHPHVSGRCTPRCDGVKRVKRRFVAVRNDGGGNRTQKGMGANSILLSILAADWTNGNSFFDHLVSAASGDG